MGIHSTVIVAKTTGNHLYLASYYAKCPRSNIGVDADIGEEFLWPDTLAVANQAQIFWHVARS